MTLWLDTDFVKPQCYKREKKGKKDAIFILFIFFLYLKYFFFK